MIISHKYKYVFVEFPRSACTAINMELVEHYDGHPILHKHATYYEFLKVASEEEKKYFVFSSIRNPLDKTVSAYYKLYSYWKDKEVKDFDFLNKFYMGRRLKFIRSKKTNFSGFFNKFYHIPYDDWSILNHREFDFIIKYENIQEDFTTVLKMLNIEKVRDIPVYNKTKNKPKNFYDYYSPEVRKKAMRIYGNYMQKWDYSFPEEWGHLRVSVFNKFISFVVNVLRKVYYKYYYRRNFRKRYLKLLKGHTGDYLPVVH
jgi:hypothetical protein